MREFPWFSLKTGLWLIASVVPAALLEGVRWVVGASFSWGGAAARWVFVVVVLFLACLARPWRVVGKVYAWSVAAGGVILIGVGIGGVYALSHTTWAAWGVIGLAYALLLGLEEPLAGDQRLLRRWIWRGVLASIAGALPVALAQMESHFADEEFFVAFQAAALAAFWLLLLPGLKLLPRQPPHRGGTRVRGIRQQLAVLLLLFAFVGLVATVRAYQRSFSPTDAPSYPGISRTTPFLCGEVGPDPQTYDGEEVFQRLLSRVEANPRKGPPEYGMLALATGDRGWAQAFRDSLLEEAEEERFTGPAHSLKSIQYEAALRAYYYPRVREAFPDLFSEGEEERVREWFAAINKRSLTVEWVDWMYGLAFSKWPEGPYENQENGAGLLALLEAGRLADPTLSPANREYLARNRRGWEARFRVTDDAIIYQPEWLHNAYFQSRYIGEKASVNKRLSLEWLLIQALPDGSPVRYNHPMDTSLVGIAYAGAHWLADPRYIWLAGRAVEALERMGRPIPAQPGVERPLNLEGVSPTVGSCLLYGDSGLPNQIGPLAPDKIVFRDGWGKEAAYLLLNLRFTGWHRYKATNTVVLIYQDGPLVEEALEGKTFSWLPEGRSLFRDKRIPRENLSGLIVRRTGMSAVLYGLTGVGGPWAQDPPYYAEVVAFELGGERDVSHTRLADWRGWRQDRWIYFYHGGPIVVVDSAEGPSGARAALVWHLTDGVGVGGGRVRLREGDRPVEVLFLPLEEPEGRLELELEGEDGGLGERVLYYSGLDGRIQLASVFLPGEWARAEVGLEGGEQPVLVIEGPERFVLPLELED